MSSPAQRTIASFEGTVARVVKSLQSDLPMRLLVAVSGGPDSVAVLHALHRIGRRVRFELTAAHLNHGIRGAESDRDERFVRELCGRLDIRLVGERLHGLKQANLEERARELRYEFLNRAADALNARYIVLGHHQGDQAETVLLRLLRGTGIAGIGAMAKLGPGRLVRPLLSLDRPAILSYLAAIGANYVIDSSNLEERAVRNRVRAQLLPQLGRDFSPRIADHLAELASEMQDVNSFIEAEASKLLDTLLLLPINLNSTASCRMDVHRFASISPALARAIMRKFIRRGFGELRGIERSHVAAMCRLATGQNPSGAVSLPRGWRLRREYDTVVLEPAVAVRPPDTSTAGREEQRLMPGANSLEADAAILTVREMSAVEADFPSAPWHPASRFEAYFDADSAPVLAARFFRPGDRIRPLGLNGSRKIQDVFVDHKIAAASRPHWPLVVSGDEVIWIPGLVRSRLALITAASKKVVYLRADSLPCDLKVRLPEL